MPDETQSEALRELRTVFPPNRREIETLSLRQRRLDIDDKLDLVFVLDKSGSMGAQVSLIADSLAGVAASIADEYSSVKYGIISFNGAGDVVRESGDSFVDLATAQSILDGLVSDSEPPPFGELVIVYDWSGQPDLDTGTTFLGETVGYGHGGSSPYMNWTGDDTSDGNETVTIDLAQAYIDGEITTEAIVNCAADWYPPAGGSGPANLTVIYNGQSDLYVINPPNLLTPAVTPARTVTITAAAANTGPENGYGAIVNAAGLPWREQAARAVLLVSDTTSREVESTFFEAEYALFQNSIFFFNGFSLDDPEGYGLLSNETGGVSIPTGTSEEITTTISEALVSISAELLDPVYIVNDNVELVATLETGEEVTFLNRSFLVNPFTSGEDGALSVSLTIDNTDFAVSRYIAQAKRSPVAVEVVMRVYINDDLSGPANLPPIALYATEFEIKGSSVACQLRWLDLHNAAFPNAFYTSKRSPSLQ